MLAPEWYSVELVFTGDAWGWWWECLLAGGGWPHMSTGAAGGFTTGTGTASKSESNALNGSTGAAGVGANGSATGVL